MKKLLVVLAVLLVPSLAHADIVIGAAGPMTGQLAVFGEQMKHGAEQAVKDINAAGGVNGEKLVLREEDDACDPKQAISAANKLVSANIKFVVGHFCSSSSLPASKVYNEEQVLMISPASSNPMLTEQGFTNIFRTYGRDDREGDILAQYMVKHFGDKKIAIVQDNSAYGRGIADQVKKTLNNAGIKEIMFESYVGGERDYSSLISKLKQAGAQVVFFGGYHPEIGLITRQMKEQGAHMQLVAGGSIATEEFWKIAGPAAEGLVMSFGMDVAAKSEAKAALDNLRKGGFEPEAYTLYTYAAVQALAEGIKRAGKDPVKVAAALRQKPVPTVMGAISFDEKGDVKGNVSAIYRWHDGKYTEIRD